MEQQAFYNYQREFGNLLADIGIALLKAGANSSRVRTTLNRVASAYQFIPHIDIGPRGISVALNSIQALGHEFTAQRNLNNVGVDFKVSSCMND